MPTQAKPLGLVLVVIYSVLTSFLLIPLGFLASFAIALPGEGGLIGVLGYLLILLGALFVALTYGLWTLQEWGQQLGIVVYAALVPLNLISVFCLPRVFTRLGPAEMFATVLSCVLCALAAMYLNSREMRALIHRAKPVDAEEDWLSPSRRRF